MIIRITLVHRIPGTALHSFSFGEPLCAGCASPMSTDLGRLSTDVYRDGGQQWIDQLQLTLRDVLIGRT